MIQLKPVALVVPCYNEAHRLQVDRFKCFLADRQDVFFYFVDDGSLDNTSAMLLALSEELPESTGVISLERNQGKAEAVRQGVLQAIQAGHSYVGYWDADLSSPLEEVDNLLACLMSINADAVLGSRVKILGHDVERHVYRHLGGRIFATLASNALDLPVYDTQCGAKIFTNNRYAMAAFAKAFISGWSFDVEILMRYKILYHLQGAALNIHEVPLKSWEDVPGSKVKVSDFFSAIYDLYKIHSHYRKQHVVDSLKEVL